MDFILWLWSDRVESEDVLECMLPPLDFAAADGSIDGCIETSATLMTSVEGGEDRGQVAPHSPSPSDVLPQMRTTVEVSVLPIGDMAVLGGGAGQEALVPSSPAVVGRGRRQEASAPSSPTVVGAAVPAAAMGPEDWQSPAQL